MSAIHTAEGLTAALAGRYEVVKHIGEGGMAAVFLARDVKHNRSVAIKVLKPDLGAVIGPERFFAEIQVTAKLQHPHLLPLFDSGVAGGALFYVMPFVAGETLRDRLDRAGPFGVDDAVRIACAVASAIDYAHRHGVVHRDLKPENILLHDNEPLVMDFGIALAVSKAGGERLTQMGMSLGTPHYMSPEQATGDRQIDGRSDVYSLAAVLYEMLAGEPPYMASNAQAIIAKVITERPPSIRATRAVVPAHIDTAIVRALAKIPADRFETALEFATAITGERLAVARAAPPTVASVAAPAPPARWRHRIVAVVAWTGAFAAAALAGAALTNAWRAERAQGFGQFLVELPDTVAIPPIGRAIALSPDGSRLAVVAAPPGQMRRLYVRQLSGLNADPLRGTEGAEAPVYSTDGAWLVYVAGGRLMKIPSDGGEPKKIADSTDGQPSWSDRDEVLFKRGGALWMVSAGGGTERPVARPDASRGERAYSWPHALPGGEYALIVLQRSGTAAAQDSSHLAVIALAGGKITDLGVVGTAPRFAAPGHIIYADGAGRLWAIPFSVSRRRVTGERALVAEAVHVDHTGAADVAVADGGLIVYSERAGVSRRRTRERSALAIVDSAGAVKSVSMQREPFYGPKVSPDGARIAVGTTEDNLRTRTGDIWMYAPATGQLTPVTRNGQSAMPEWAPDGRRLFYLAFGDWPGHWVAQPWDLSGTAQPFMTSRTPATNLSVGQRGSHLAVLTMPGTNISIAPLSSPSSLEPFVATPSSTVSPRLSPNGRWLAYASDEASTFQIYVSPVPGPGPRVPVSIADGIEPVWSKDGRTLYYVAGGQILAARVDESRGFLVTRRDTMFSLTAPGSDYVIHPPSDEPTLGFYDSFPNGGFVLITRTATTDSTRSNVIAILNWSKR